MDGVKTVRPPGDNAGTLETLSPMRLPSPPGRTQTGTTCNCGAMVTVKTMDGGITGYGFGLPGAEGWGFRGIFGNNVTYR